MPPKTYPDDLRDRLVNAALERLRHCDVDQVSLRDLAAECDTSTNAIYTIFGSKDALVDAVARLAREQFLRPLFTYAAGEATIETLTDAGTQYRRWALENPGLYRLLFANPAGSGYAPRAEMVAPLRLMLSRLQEAGVLAHEDTDQMCLSVWASTHGFVMLEMEVWPEGSVDTDELYQFHLGNCLGRVTRARPA